MSALMFRIEQVRGNGLGYAVGWISQPCSGAPKSHIHSSERQSYAGNGNFWLE